MTAAKRPLIIGIGNRLRGDDGAGPESIRLLASGSPLEVDLVEATGEGASLMESWRGRECVIVIDAARPAGVPGRVHRLDAAQQAVPGDFFHYSTHAFGLAEAVEMSRTLGELPERLTVYAIEGVRFETGAGLSPDVAAAMARVIEGIRSQLERPH